MHPAEEIFCEKSNKLRGKTIVIGITGSIAATECFSAIRELIRHGAKVIPVMSAEAQKIITQFDMKEIENSKAKTLSGGWQRRLSIAMALISEPKVIFLDDSMPEGSRIR